MNKFALVTVAAIPGQGSGTSAFKKAEVWKEQEKPVVSLQFENEKKFPNFEAWEEWKHGEARKSRAKKTDWIMEQIQQQSSSQVAEPLNAYVRSDTATREDLAFKKVNDYVPSGAYGLTPFKRADDYAPFKDAYAAFGGKAIELYVDDEWHPWYGDKMPSFNMPPENYRVKEGY